MNDGVTDVTSSRELLASPTWDLLDSPIIEADCIEAMAAIPEASVDVICTDPPYALTNRTPDVLRCVDCGRVCGGRDGAAESCPRCGGGLERQRSEGGAGFMGQIWDTGAVAFDPATWQLALRILKPGGHLLAFGGTRTYHRLACAIEDAGFEIRDSIMWIYGSGFPKSLDVSKAIDKRGGNAHLATEIGRAIKVARERRRLTVGAADRQFCGGSTNWSWYEGRNGVCRPPTPADFDRIAREWPELTPLAAKVAEARREKIGEAHGAQAQSTGRYGGWGNDEDKDGVSSFDLTVPSTPGARRWQGWGTALKPAHEPIVVARKPLVGTVAQNVLEHGTGAVNVDACRINGPKADGSGAPPLQFGGTNHRPFHDTAKPREFDTSAGRWPANVVLSHLEDCAPVGTKQVKKLGTRAGAASDNAGEHGTGDGATYMGRKPSGSHYGDADGTETVTAWNCAPGCPVAMLDEQSGDRSSPWIGNSNVGAKGGEMFGGGEQRVGGGKAGVPRLRRRLPLLLLREDEQGGARSRIKGGSTMSMPQKPGGSATAKGYRQKRRRERRQLS